MKYLISGTMHEVSIVSNIVEAILKELEKYNVEKVETVTLLIGDLTNLVHEQLEFAFEIVTKETCLEDAKLIINREKVIVKCSSCGYEGEPNNLESDFYEDSIPILACPKCNESVEIIAGEACRVTSLDIKEAE